LYSQKLTLALDADLSSIPEDGPVFGTRAWLEATRAALPFPLQVLKVFKHDDFVAYLPLQFIRKGLVKAFAPILTYYGGPYFIGADRKYFNEEAKERYEILTAILEYLERHAHYCLLLPGEGDARPALARGWRCTPRYTVVNLLGSESSAAFNKDCRSNIRRAERNGLVCAPTGSEGAFAEAYARTFVRKGLAMKWKADWAADLRRELTARGLMENLSVRTAAGKEIAFGSVIFDVPRRSAILWQACSLAEGEQAGALYLLYQDLVLRYQGRYDTLDLCGADHRGLSEFKEKFAQKLEVRFALEKYRNPVSEALIKGYAWARGAVG
jgi:hypothetical protein